MNDRPRPRQRLHRFLDQQSRIAMFLIEADIESALAAYQALLHSDGRIVDGHEAMVLSSSSGDVFAPSLNPASHAVIGFHDSDWTLIQHQFSDLSFSDLQRLNSRAALLHEAGRVLRFVAMGKAIPLECDLSGKNHRKETFYRVSDQDLRCSLVNEFDEFAAEMGVEVPETEGEAISNFDELLHRLDAKFVPVGCTEKDLADQVTVAPADADQIARVVLFR